jgi:hypothetical protein
MNPAARRSRSLIASPRPSSGIGATAMPTGFVAVGGAQIREQVRGGLGQVAEGAEVEHALPVRPRTKRQERLAGLGAAASIRTGASGA